MLKLALYCAAKTEDRVLESREMRMWRLGRGQTMYEEMQKCTFCGDL